MNTYVYLFLGLIILLILIRPKENFTVSYDELSGGFICNKAMDSTAYNNSLCKKLNKDISIDRLSKVLVDGTPINLSNKHLGKFQYNSCPDEFTELKNIDFRIRNNVGHKEYNNTNIENCKKMTKEQGYVGFTINKFNRCSLKKQLIHRDKFRKQGTTSYILGGGSQFTISYWINIKSTDTHWRRLFLAGNGSDSNRCPGIYVYPNRTGIHFRCSTETNTNDGLDIADGNIILNRWTHIATVLYGKSIKHYVDGVLVGSKDLSSPTNFNNNVKLELGGSGSYTNNFIDISQFTIFSIALPENYIKTVLLENNPNINCKTLKNIPKFCEYTKIKNKYIDSYVDTDDILINSVGSKTIPGSLFKNRGIPKQFPNIENRTVRLLGLPENVHYKNTYLEQNSRQPSVKRFLTNNLIILTGRCIVNESQKTIGYLPINCRPDHRLVFPRLEGTGIRVDIYPDGRIERVAGYLNKGELSFDGLLFNKNTGTQIDFSIKRGCRYVRVLLPKHDYLNIAEVEVYDNLGKNIASGKTATQSSYYGGKSGNSRINPLNALDGNTDGLYGKGDNISHTGYGSNQWWMVDLGASHNVTKVKVYNRSDKCCDQRIGGAKIQLLDINKHEIISQTWDPNDFIKEKNYRVEKNNDYPGYDINRLGSDQKSVENCGEYCKSIENCKSFSYIKSGSREGKCFIKNKLRPNRVRNSNTDSGYIRLDKIYPKNKTFVFKQDGDGRLSTNWDNYGGVYRNGCYSIIDNKVYLSGLIKYTAENTYMLPCVIGQLPKNCRPSNTHLFNVSNNIGTASIEVDKEGIIKIIEAGDHSGTARKSNWISLDGINWDTSQSLDLTLESSWKNLGSSISSDLMNGNILNINFFKGDGNNKGYSLGNLSKFKITGNQTISMTLKAYQNGRQNPISKAYGGEGTLTIETNGSITYYYGNSGHNSSPYQGFNSKKSIKWGKETHIVVVRDIIRKKLTWYMDGAKTSEADMKLIPVESDNDLLIGKGYQKQFKGTISSLLLFNRVLSINEVNQLSKSTGLVGKNYGSPKITKNKDYVSLQGVIGSKDSNYKGTIITKLPTGFRPNKDLIFYINGNGKSNKVLVGQNGSVLFLEGDNGEIISLDNIYFMTYK